MPAIFRRKYHPLAFYAGFIATGFFRRIFRNCSNLSLLALDPFDEYFLLPFLPSGLMMERMFRLVCLFAYLLPPGLWCLDHRIDSGINIEFIECAPVGFWARLAEINCESWGIVLVELKPENEVQHGCVTVILSSFQTSFWRLNAPKMHKKES